MLAFVTVAHVQARASRQHMLGAQPVDLFWGHRLILTLLRGVPNEGLDPVVWIHTCSGMFEEVRGGLLVGNEHLHSEEEGQSWSLSSTPKPPHPRPQLPYLPSVSNDSISPPRGL